MDMTQLLGPAFKLVEEIDVSQLDQVGGFGHRTRPLLVKGALRNWPASQNWSFEKLAELRNKDGSEPTRKFQNGLVEQGETQERPLLPIAPYLRELAGLAGQPVSEDVGLLPNRRRRLLQPGEEFHLNWAHMQSFTPHRNYLAQWSILEDFPQLRSDFDIQSLWPGWRWTWESVFIGPANTHTGLHRDVPNNWFCQARGVKEFIMFQPSEEAFMSPSKKYDWGATLSSINIARFDEHPEQLRALEQAKGLYVRVEEGDALFIPKRTWHAVVSLAPSISLAVFGLTAPEILLEGVPTATKDLLHNMHLYRWGHCICHKHLA